LNVQPPITVKGAENVRLVMLDVSKEAVPVGTVAGFQLLLLLKMLSAGTASQVAFCARATPGSSAATATNVVVASSAAIRPFRRSRVGTGGRSSEIHDRLATSRSPNALRRQISGLMLARPNG